MELTRPLELVDCIILPLASANPGLSGQKCISYYLRTSGEPSLQEAMSPSC